MKNNKSIVGLKKIRCAIYTRKSTEEGLDQAFNSLHAQREACEAYIRSQAHEGWVALDTPYDDGGFSGGNVDRPALAHLLADMNAGLIDLVLVYKVDRLSRSLADFVRLIEQFDQQNIAFVSVTQQFNTSSSMGRLTLNVLLSFAQFEREVTGERIRDKIAASKKKGLWMGGTVPLGYDVVDRQLQINPDEAKQVERIYRYYLIAKCVRKLKGWCEQENIRSKLRMTKAGRSLGGHPFSRGALYTILKNPIYIGKIAHRGALFDGQHKPVIDQVLWQQVQDQLQANCRKKRLRTEAKSPSLLAGLLFDDRNNPMSPSHTRKANRRYCYYVSQARLQMRENEAGSVVCVSGDIIEPLVIHLMTDYLINHDQLLNDLPMEQLNAEDRTRLMKEALTLGEKLNQSTITQQIDLLHQFVEWITISRNRLRIKINPGYLLNALLPDKTQCLPPSNNTSCLLEQSITLKRSGIETRSISGRQKEVDPNTSSIQALGRAALKAMKWHQDLITGRIASVKAIANKENVSVRLIQERLKLALLSPQMIKSLLGGKIEELPNLEQLKGLQFTHKWAGINNLP